MHKYSAILAATEPFRYKANELISKSICPLKWIMCRLSGKSVIGQTFHMRSYNKHVDLACESYEDRVKSTLRSYGMSAEDFNEISNYLQRNPAAKARVLLQAYYYRISADLESNLEPTLSRLSISPSRAASNTPPSSFSPSQSQHTDVTSSSSNPSLYGGHLDVEKSKERVTAPVSPESAQLDASRTRRDPDGDHLFIMRNPGGGRSRRKRVGNTNHHNSKKPIQKNTKDKKESTGSRTNKRKPLRRVSPLRVLPIPDRNRNRNKDHKTSPPLPLVTKTDDVIVPPLQIPDGLSMGKDKGVAEEGEGEPVQRPWVEASEMEPLLPAQELKPDRDKHRTGDREQLARFSNALHEIELERLKQRASIQAELGLTDLPRSLFEPGLRSAMNPVIQNAADRFPQIAAFILEQQGLHMREFRQLQQRVSRNPLFCLRVRREINRLERDRSFVNYIYSNNIYSAGVS